MSDLSVRVGDCMIVTIDGPAGAGKSSAAKRLADRLGFRFLDTGAMYRAVALAAEEQGIDKEDQQAWQQLLQSTRIEVGHDRVTLNGRDVTQAIRTQQITNLTRFAADQPVVRRQLVVWQQQIGNHANVVTEGRDQATVVFPQAECKVFLTADPETRARRRFDDMVARGESVTYEEVLARQQARDEQDTNRPIGGLLKAGDAVELDTSGMSPDEVVDSLEAIVREHVEPSDRQSHRASQP